MGYLKYKEQILNMMDSNYKDFVMALISVERNIDNEEILSQLYERFMDNDDIQLIDGDI